MAAVAATGSTLQNVTDNQKRWLVFGIALNKVLISQIRSFVEQEVQKQYGSLQTSHSIHTQSTSGRLKKWPTFLKYENINGNDVFPRLPGARFDYSKFDCRVTSHVDFAKLYVENHMAKFNAFDEHCDASAVLTLLGKVPVFSLAVQSAAGDVRQARNAWAHCAFSDWGLLSFQQRFAEMENLVKSLGLPCADEVYFVNELKDWETKGAILCLNATIDPDLVKTVQQDVNALKNDVDKMAFDEEVNRENVKKALHDSQLVLEELRERVAIVEHEQEVIRQDLCGKVNTAQDQISELKSEQEDVQRRVTYLEDQQKSNQPQINYEIANCESDIAFLAARHDADTRQWLLKDFDKWFSDSGDSRAYVVLGDPGVGKSVMAGVLAQRSREAGHLGAAYICRHNDSTRNDPRYLLGTIASQLCKCSIEYNSIMGGEDGVTKMLGNSNLGVQEFFTKLLQEPLYKCHSTQRKLVVIDALDETQYESREDFLDLLMNRFPLLPNWLLFFITSRPENTLQISLKKYNPCVRICAGNVEHGNFYQQHEQDIKLFLRNRVDFSRFPFSVDDLVKKCNGSFLYAFYIAKDLNAPTQSGKSFQLVDLFPGDFDNFLRKNFKRVFVKVGSSLFKKLFGCAITAPAPLPVSFISYVLQREKSSISKQHVLDALSLFMVLSETFDFLHNLIPAWLTDEDMARELSIDRNIEGSYFKDVILEILLIFIREQSQDVPLIKLDLLYYVLRVGIRFLSVFPENNSLETVFNCLTSFKYIEKRIQSRRIEICSLIEDYKLAADCQGEDKKEILLEVCSALERNIYVLLECPYLLHSCLQNASKVVQDNVVIPDGVSTTWLQCSSRILPWTRLASPDKKMLPRIIRHREGAFFSHLIGGSGTMYSLSLRTGAILASVSGKIPLSFSSNPGRPAVEVPEGPMQVGFFSADLVQVLYSNLWLVAVKTVDHEGSRVYETSLNYPFRKFHQVTKSQFSPDGKLIVIYESTKILLYRDMLACTGHGGKCPDSIFETNGEFVVLHFTFSADSTLLLVCIRRSSGVSFFVWKVWKKVLPASFDSPELTSEDCCCCFSSNNTELIVCSEFCIEFWDHSSHPCRLLRRVQTGVAYTEVYKLTHCAVSPESDLLAYCIADRIFLFSLETSTDQLILQLPRAHLGKVEFCQFLRGNRYLISYGVDGTVFLWDLSEWKAVGFAKIAQGRENIVSMAVSAEGDKVVCLTSFGRLNVVKACGLKDAILTKLPLPKGTGSEKLTQAFRGQVREPTATIQNRRCPDNTENLDAAELTEEMEFMSCSDDNEYSDEDSDELLD